MRRIILLVASLNILLAGVDGKLAGTVRDQDGAALIGVNVILQGTAQGAATGSAGDYYFLNIPPGTYTVRFTMIGYETVEQRSVLIRSDLTTRLDATLKQTVLESKDVIEVIAERPLIQQDATSTIKVLSASDIINMPVESVNEILASQPGFTTDAGGTLHVRGGRGQELLYIVDGIVVRDPLGGDFVGSVNQNSIQELTVISGTFNAEYGQAMSGVVNIITRDGGQALMGRLDFLSDVIQPSPFHQKGAFPAVTDERDFRWIDLGARLPEYYKTYSRRFSPRPILPLMVLGTKGTLSGSLSGPLLPRLTYFTAVQLYNRDSYLPFGTSLNQDLQLKLTARPIDRLKITGQLHSSQSLAQGYSHVWKYLPENQAHSYSAIERLSLAVNHSLSPAMYYTFQIARQNMWSRIGVRDLDPAEYEKSLTGGSVYFNESGTAGTYSLNTNTTFQTRADLTWQVNPRHLIKTGTEFSRYALDIHNQEQPWTDGINFIEDTSFTPVEGAFYIQDKIEFDYLIINIGLRWDYLDPRTGMWKDVSRFGYRDPVTQKIIPAPTVDVIPRQQWSPRIGLAYPVTDRTVFHFSYGHFFQTPPFNAMYYNTARDMTAALPLIGNPRVLPQKTISFEGGFNQALSRDVALTVNLWSKDIRDLLSTRQYRYLSTEYVVYSNTDYASVKGLDLSVDKRFDRHFGASVTYTLSVAKGNNSNPIAGYFSAFANEEIPHQEYFLDFDQRHDLAVNLQFTGPTESRLMSGFYGNLLINAGSGLPYTPYVDPAFRVDINSARKPHTETIDLRLNREITFGGIKLTGMMEINNLTDYKNIRYVYSRTGRPFDPGFSGVGTSPDANYNPAHIGPGREIKLGLFLEW